MQYNKEKSRHRQIVPEVPPTNNIFLIAAKKHLTKKYTLSINEENFEDNNNIIGKLSSNFMGTIFNIYSNGKHPKKSKNMTEIRQQYGCVTYVICFDLY